MCFHPKMYYLQNQTNLFTIGTLFKLNPQKTKNNKKHNISPYSNQLQFNEKIVISCTGYSRLISNHEHK